MLRACLVCVISNAIVFVPLYSKFVLNDCSHIEDVHLLYCSHFTKKKKNWGVLNLDIFM